jgi:hypothetical protein
MWILIIAGLMSLAGCGDPLMEGVAIGLGTSTASQDALDLAKETKTALVAQILQLQQELDAAVTPEDYAAIKAELDAAQKKQEYVDLTESIAATVKDGIGRDWSKPASNDNLAWILGSVATVLGGVAGKKTLDDRKKGAAIARAKIASKPAAEKELYEVLDQGA